MKWSALPLMAARNLRRNGLRTFLTALGIVIGIGAVITMVGLGQGASSEVEEQVNRLGHNVLLVFPGDRELGGEEIDFVSGRDRNVLDPQDAIAIKEEIPEVVAASPEVRSTRVVVHGNQAHPTHVYGQNYDYLQVRNWPLERGQMFTEEHVATGATVAVVGQTIVDELFDGANPIGETIRVRGLALEVIGVLQRRGMSLMGSVQDDLVLAPYTTAHQRISGRTHSTVYNLQVYDDSAMELAEARITDFLRERHNIGPGDEDNFTVQSQEAVAETATETSRIMTFLLASIAGISLFVGGIGIMNVMLVSVSERTREIGLRLSVGARGRDVLSQFLVEATALCILGGVGGILVGMGATRLIAEYAGWPALFSTEAMVVAVTVSGAVGIFFGFYPAWKASRLDPMEALRRE